MPRLKRESKHGGKRQGQGSTREEKGDTKVFIQVMMMIAGTARHQCCPDFRASRLLEEIRPRVTAGAAQECGPPVNFGTVTVPGTRMMRLTNTPSVYTQELAEVMFGLHTLATSCLTGSTAGAGKEALDKKAVEDIIVHVMSKFKGTTASDVRFYLRRKCNNAATALKKSVGKATGYRMFAQALRAVARSKPLMQLGNLKAILALAPGPLTFHPACACEIFPDDGDHGKLVRNSSSLELVASGRQKKELKRPIYAAVDPKLSGETGYYFSDCRKAWINWRARNAERNRELFETSVKRTHLEDSKKNTPLLVDGRPRLTSERSHRMSSVLPVDDEHVAKPREVGLVEGRRGRGLRRDSRPGGDLLRRGRIPEERASGLGAVVCLRRRTDMTLLPAPAANASEAAVVHHDAVAVDNEVGDGLRHLHPHHPGTSLDVGAVSEGRVDDRIRPSVQC
ncbi:hypothetical protein HPB47_022040 [Ixodes persulcatus]|uniref:Uncharacterized protein n=1 Tax=Ixodes persulcatus TaxID=34615 RepID=A0AC60QBU0_IXOPE|nr:hypothetical protein HPB47_022040 [Ixodes persulcatus]